VTALESRPVSPTSERVEIGPETLIKYIPQDQGAIMIPTRGADPAALSDDEKQQLVKALHYLKQEVDALKKTVEEMKASTGKAQQGGAGPKLIDLSRFDREEDGSQASREPENSPEIRPLKESQDDMIEKCLAKHGGKVKPAAAELGISERTIYRRIAEKKGK